MCRVVQPNRNLKGCQSSALSNLIGIQPGNSSKNARSGCCLPRDLQAFSRGMSFPSGSLPTLSVNGHTQTQKSSRQWHLQYSYSQQGILLSAAQDTPCSNAQNAADSLWQWLQFCSVQY